MLDIHMIRADPEGVRRALLKRMEEVDFAELLEWDGERRALIAESEALKAAKNAASRQIPLLKREGGNVTAELARLRAVSEQIAALEARLAAVARRIEDFLAALPNLPAADVPAGGKEQNRVVREWGRQPGFGFEPLDHVTLSERLGLVDYRRGAGLGGAGHWLYRGDGARLEWALINFFVRTHLEDGYEFVLPPHLLTHACGFVAGQFPKFAADVYQLPPEVDDRPSRFLLPTAETALVNLHRDEILPETDLPRKYFAYTPCYRREAGSYRTAERGMIRGHQFNKVEMFQFARPEDSEAALQELVAKAERLVRELGLHHRVVLLAAGDCGAAMAKTYDVEVWVPSMKEYKEVSSASNAGDYQARRGRIRFRRGGSGKIEFVHSLNASGLATSRLFPAILEQFQRADGSVVVPAALREWVGKDILSPAA